MRRDVVVLFSDWHIGKMTDDYDLKEFVKRLEVLEDEILESKSELNKSGRIHDLHVMFLGDIVDGEGIFYSQGYEAEMPVEEQVEFALKHIEPMLRRLSKRFRNVHVYGIYGNHARANGLSISHWDRVLYRRLEDRLGNEIDFHIGDWKYVANVNGMKFLLIHGDGIRMYSNIPLYGIIQRAMRFKSAGIDFDALVLGHFHTSFDMQWNDIRIIGNGTFVSSDEWALRRMGLKSDTSQTMLVIEDGKITWVKRIDLEV